MFKISKILFSVIVLFLLVWQVPACYNFFMSTSVDTPFTLYSSIAGEFATLQVDENKKMQIKWLKKIKQFDMVYLLLKMISKEMTFLLDAKERQEEEQFKKLDRLIRQQQSLRKTAGSDNPVERFKRLFLPA
mgnify:CR=1 FL=1